jgi:pimeloyl-ACP methyl ester carboxylesterase
MRQLVTVTVGGVRLRGTYHMAQDQPSGLPSNLNVSTRIGILFLNSGVAPRSAGGDAAVHWADSLSKRGYPSFRFDLPGLGDSEGDLPVELLEFGKMVDSGYYTPFICGIAKDLTEWFRLSGVVLVGHCTGAVSAIFAAADCKYVKGVVALEPYFFQPEDVRKNWRNQVRLWAARDIVGGQLKNIYSRLKRVRLLVMRNKLPKNANLSLIRSWKHLVSATTPMLVLNARGAGSPLAQFDYFRYVTRGGGRIAVKFIEGAQHHFADRIGRAAVWQHTEQWLRTSFPLAEP